MITSIQLENYRGFKAFGLGPLSRVNLLVGKNNCGKTSVLEAVQILASGGDPRVAARIASQRGEMVPRGEERAMYPVISHFFHGHEFCAGAYFSVSSGNGVGKTFVRVMNLADIEEPSTLFEDAIGVRSAYAVRFETTNARGTISSPTFGVTEDGAILPDLPVYRSRRAMRHDREDSPPVQFITPDSLEPRSMSEMWNGVLTEGRENEVIEAMRILEPTLTNIFFLSGDAAYRFAGRAGILAAFEGTQRRDPLGSHGEGMRRLLALSLSLIRTKDGVLLVDEIDTGLHYSIMGDMWRLIVETARRANVQVFATTHSFDCIRGLAWLCDNYPSLQEEISLQKIVDGLDEAVALDAEGLKIAVEQGVEVR